MKKVVALVSLPGGGKTTLARKLVREAMPEASDAAVDLVLKGFEPCGSPVVVCSADHYFIDGEDGDKYKFRSEDLPLAHHECQRLCLLAMTDEVPLVIVDNCNLTERDRAFYAAAARKHGYELEYRLPGTPWQFDPEECARRTTHGVPLEIIRRMAEHATYPPVNNSKP